MRHNALSYAAPSLSVIRQYAATAFQLVAPALFKTTLFLLVTSGLFFSVKETLSAFPVPIHLEIQKNEKERQREKIHRAFQLLWGKAAPQPFIEGIWLGAKSIRTKEIDPVLLVVLLHTESHGKIDAVSNKSYKGLMQTPTMTKIAEADIVHGAKILDTKLSWTAVNPGADIRTALALYKGGKNPQAFRQADEVIALYKRVKQQLG